MENKFCEETAKKQAIYLQDIGTLECSEKLDFNKYEFLVQEEVF